jgi:hypothetical protein
MSWYLSLSQVNNLREIQALRRLSPHDHIITLEEGELRCATVRSLQEPR